MKSNKGFIDGTGKLVKVKDVYQLDLNRLPKHIAIIMDGNGRWAKKRGFPRVLGHRAGVESIRDVIKTCADINIEVLSLYAFSTENWKRPKNEVDSLMKLLVENIKKEAEQLHTNNIKILISGRLEYLPDLVRERIKYIIELTKHNTGLVVNIAINYGGRAEIIDAVKKICIDYSNNKFVLEDLSEDFFKEYLYTANLPDPDLLIRPSGEYRISNFLIYQCAYTEFWFSDILWPDFKRKHLINAIKSYQERNRRFGDIK